jgi:hypothetical protein
MQLPVILVLSWYHRDRGQPQVARGKLAVLILFFLVGGTFWSLDGLSTANPDQPSVLRTAQPSAGRVNAVIAIHPYKSGGVWVFDDPSVGLVREPFVLGADDIIERLVAGLDRPEDGFTLLFSASPFPGYQTVFEWRRSEMGGNWYYSAKAGMEGWLCPALFKYFDSAPPRIYAQFKSSGSPRQP